MTIRYKGDFGTRIAGIPCQIGVTWYSEERPMLITGWGFGDAEAPEPEEFEYIVLDHKGYPASWLADKLTDDDRERILNEYKQYRRDLNEY